MGSVIPFPTAALHPAVAQTLKDATKPWYLSKKIWLMALALALALVQSLTGKWTNLTPDQLYAMIASAATYLLPILGTILAIAHVDGKKYSAAIMAVGGLATSLNQPSADAVPGP